MSLWFHFLLMVGLENFFFTCCEYWYLEILADEQNSSCKYTVLYIIKSSVRMSKCMCNNNLIQSQISPHKMYMSSELVPEPYKMYMGSVIKFLKVFYFGRKCLMLEDWSSAESLAAHCPPWYGRTACGSHRLQCQRRGVTMKTRDDCRCTQFLPSTHEWAFTDSEPDVVFWKWMAACSVWMTDSLSSAHERALEISYALWRDKWEWVADYVQS
jgi:hypothetical protein